MTESLRTRHAPVSELRQPRTSVPWNHLVSLETCGVLLPQNKLRLHCISTDSRDAVQLKDFRMPLEIRDEDRVRRTAF